MRAGVIEWDMTEEMKGKKEWVVGDERKWLMVSAGRILLNKSSDMKNVYTKHVEKTLDLLFAFFGCRSQ
jgi:hypothetical protein